LAIETHWVKMDGANDDDRIGSLPFGFADVRLRVPGGFGLAVVRHCESDRFDSPYAKLER